MQNCMMEWSFHSQKKHRDPFNEIEFSVVFKGPGGEEKIVPGFWSGENLWRVRFAPRHRIQGSMEKQAGSKSRPMKERIRFSCTAR